MKVKYLDHRDIYFPYLENYKGGLTLPSKDNIIEVTDSEFSTLKKHKNGNKNCFEKVKPEIKKPEISEE